MQTLLTDIFWFSNISNSQFFQKSSPLYKTLQFCLAIHIYLPINRSKTFNLKKYYLFYENNFIFYNENHFVNFWIKYLTTQLEIFVELFVLIYIQEILLLCYLDFVHKWNVSIKPYFSISNLKRNKKNILKILIFLKFFLPQLKWWNITIFPQRKENWSI